MIISSSVPELVTTKYSRAEFVWNETVHYVTLLFFNNFSAVVINLVQF